MIPTNIRYSAVLSDTQNTARTIRARIQSVGLDSDQWLSRQEAAELVNRDPRSIDRWVTAGQLTSVRAPATYEDADGSYERMSVWVWRDELLDVAARKDAYLKAAQESKFGGKIT